MSCNICIETFNRSNRRVVVCPSCNFEACKECCEKYISESPENASCMNCKAEWDYNTLVKLFTRSFVDGKYKKHVEKLLFDRELALLPATQPIVEEEKRREAINKRMKQIKDQIASLKKELRVCTIEYYRQPVSKIQTFVRKCPGNDCRGFLSSQWKCGMCNVWCCPDCHEIRGFDKNAEHVCKQENIETARLLEKDTKPCPKCACPIFKIEGCDQMFCTQCQTPFSWTTGKVENGVIHNPHYFEWQKQRGTQQRNLLEIRCGREIDHNFVNNIYSIFSTDTNNVARNLIHVRSVDLPRYVVNRINDNQDLRVKYLKSEITQEQFKRRLQQRQKTAQKQQEIANILHVYLSCSTEIFYRLVDDYQNNGAYTFDGQTLQPAESKYMKEWLELVKYINGCFANISKTYKTHPYAISKYGTFVTHNLQMFSIPI